MIRGAVNAAYEPIVRIAVRGPSGLSREIEAIVDTGYNGYLTLPPALASALELPFVTSNPGLLADGTEVTFEVRSATVLWDGHPRDIDAHMSDATPLIGMRLLDGHSLHMDVLDGGRVAIAPVTAEPSTP